MAIFNQTIFLWGISSLEISAGLGTSTALNWTSVVTPFGQPFVSVTADLSTRNMFKDPVNGWIFPFSFRNIKDWNATLVNVNKVSITAPISACTRLVSSNGQMVFTPQLGTAFSVQPDGSLFFSGLEAGKKTVFSVGYSAS